MKVSGTTFIRNATIYNYPVVEAIKSILPICDEFIVNVGDSIDNTEEMVRGINDKRIKIIHSVWDENLREGGKIFALQTNIALKEASGDWIFHINADEAVHEEDLDKIYTKMKENFGNKKVEGLTFEFIHFYGSYYTYQKARNWYRREVRVIRNGLGIMAYRDGQGFRKESGKKIFTVPSGAKIYHYGWARSPVAMKEKVLYFSRFWHDDQWIEEKIQSKAPEEIFGDLANLRIFTGTHPKVMQEKVNDEGLLFILQLREKYLSRRKPLEAIRDFLRRIYIFEYRGFLE
jgi:glycosyltransferase involved in cell wall biosynthesis